MGLEEAAPAEAEAEAAAGGAAAAAFAPAFFTVIPVALSNESNSTSILSINLAGKKDSSRHDATARRSVAHSATARSLASPRYT